MSVHDETAGHPHSHVFLGSDHESSERRTWAVIILCGLMMVAEIIGGLLFGSIALVADGLHMSTHAGALLLAALAYSYSRKHATDERFTFGTGKLGDLAGFTSAIVLAMIALEASCAVRTGKSLFLCGGADSSGVALGRRFGGGHSIDDDYLREAQ